MKLASEGDDGMGEITVQDRRAEAEGVGTSPTVSIKRLLIIQDRDMPPACAIFVVCMGLSYVTIRRDLADVIFEFLPSTMRRELELSTKV